jgi:hypothetical protein
MTFFYIPFVCPYPSFSLPFLIFAPFSLIHGLLLLRRNGRYGETLHGEASVPNGAGDNPPNTHTIHDLKRV